MPDTTKPDPLRAPALDQLQPAGIRHGYFTRVGGVSDGIYQGLNIGMGSHDDPAKVRENRRRVAAGWASRRRALLTAYQIHSPDVIVVSEPFPGERPKADAHRHRPRRASPSAPRPPIAVRCCSPTPKRGVIGAAHAGWKGAFTGVLENTVAAMERLGAQRERIIAVLGPSIGPDNYEVGPEFVERFIDAETPATARYFSPSQKPGHAMFDLNRYTVDRLPDAGVAASMLDRCTYAEEELFYSYRRTTHRKEAGLRPPDLGDRPGEKLMALHFERTEFDARRDRLMIEMAEKKLDAMLLFAQESMYWLTGYDTFGFCFFQSLVVKADGSMVLLTRSADLRQARHTSIIENIVVWTDRDNANPTLDLRNLLNDLDLLGTRIGVEYDTHGLTAFNGRRLDEQLHDLRPDRRRIRHRVAAAAVQEPGRNQQGREGGSACRRRARRGAAADQARRRRGADPGRHAGRDLCRRRRLSGQRIHHRLRARTRCCAATRPAAASSTKNDQLTLEWAGVFHHYHAAMMRTALTGKASNATRNCSTPAATRCWRSRRR